MDRGEREAPYTEPGRPIPTDLGRMVHAVALVRLALLALLGVPLLLAACCLGPLAVFAVWGTSPLSFPAKATPTPTPAPTATPTAAGPVTIPPGATPGPGLEAMGAEASMAHGTGRVPAGRRPPHPHRTVKQV